MVKRKEVTLFRDIDSVLRWAYYINSTRVVKMSAINGMYGKPRPSTLNDLIRGLTPQECQQQAAEIIHLADDIKDTACVEYIPCAIRQKI